MSMQRLLRLCAFVAVAAAATACGDQEGTVSGNESTASPTTAAELPVVVVDDEVQVGCWGPPGWSPAVMAEGVADVFTDAEMEAIFRELLADPQLAPELELSFLSEGARETEWRVLAHDESTVILGLGAWTAEGPVDGAYVMGLKRRGEGWTWSGGGGCQLEPVLQPDHTWVELHAPSGGLDRDGTVVTVGVNERACTGARDPGPHLHDPGVVEDSDSVTVYWTSRPPRGASTCPGNPTVERTFTLEEPLGERTLLDGSTYPPREVD